MKMIFITWWVVSGLWKWITSSSIWKILSSAWYKINMVKMDPYLQIDAWTISPYEHWEVFVTEDWGETDLDIWNYERFTWKRFHKNNNITTWKVYLDVINRERKWDYLWKTVQIVPHITDNIKEKLINLDKNNDITIVEVGWTVWDIESLPFLEAIRQMKKDIWKENIAYIHLAPLLYLNYSWETKTKPIQHSVSKLREYWIIPDILVCRTEKEMELTVKEKISNLCDIDIDSIIESINVESIYQIPLSFKKQNLERILEKKLNLKMKNADLKKWETLTNNIINPKYIVSIWIVWKYTAFKDAYLSLIESLKHSWAHNNCKVNLVWINSELLEKKDEMFKFLSELKEKWWLDWIIVPWGFWSRWVAWKINAIQFARENDIPFLWICLGLQLAVIEFLKNVWNIKNADSSEFSPKTKFPVIDLMEQQKNVENKWWTMRLWNYSAILKDWTLAKKIILKWKYTRKT